MLPILEKVKVEVKDKSTIGVVPVTPLGPYKITQIMNASLIETVKRTK